VISEPLNFVKILLLAGIAALVSPLAFAQTDASLATPTGHEVNASVGGYTAPAFTIDGSTDVSFSQSGGWALRASAKYPVFTTLVAGAV
jgi:hypothetical protein